MVEAACTFAAVLVISAEMILLMWITANDPWFVRPIAFYPKKEDGNSRWVIMKEYPAWTGRKYRTYEPFGDEYGAWPQEFASEQDAASKCAELAEHERNRRIQSITGKRISV